MKSVNEIPFKVHVAPIKTAAFIAKSVNNPFRQKILNLLLLSGGMVVNELCDSLASEQSVMSQHLAILRKAKLVTAERSGKSVRYSANERQVQEVIDCMLYLDRLLRE